MGGPSTAALMGEKPPAELESFRKKLVETGKWQPELFVDLCEKARKKPGEPSYALLARIQEVEWEHLLKYVLG